MGKIIHFCAGLIGAGLLTVLLLGPLSVTTWAGDQLRPYMQPPPVQQQSTSTAQPSYVLDFAKSLRGLNKAQLDDLQKGLEANRSQAIKAGNQASALYYQALVDQVERTKIQRGFK